MLVRRSRWLLIVALFVLAPMVGLVGGVFGGLQLMGAVDEVDTNTGETEVAEPMQTEEAGAPSPTVTLPNGEAVAVDELAPGRKVALIVMKDARCPVCHDQLQRLSERLDEIERRGATVIGLTDANPCVAQDLMGRLGLKFPIVSDTDGEMREQFQLTVADRPYIMPGIIFIDEQGDVDHIHRGRAPGQQRLQEKMILKWL